MAYFAIDYYIREGSANSSGPPKWKQWIFVFLHYQEVQGLFMLTFKTQILSLVSVFASQILPTSTEWQRSDGNISRMCLHAVWALWESTGTRGARTETRPSCCFLSCTGQRSPVPTCLCSFIQNAAVTSLNEALRFDEVTLPGLLLFFFFFWVTSQSVSHVHPPICFLSSIPALLSSSILSSPNLCQVSWRKNAV